MDIAILGAGIAGASAALTLSLRGHRVRLYERRPEAATMGAGVVLWPNAGFVLSELGLSAEVAAAGGRPCAMRKLDRQGCALGHVDVRYLDRLMGFPTRSILRRDLQSILLRQLAARGIEISYGAGARTIEAGPGGLATVRLDDGRSVRADLIIGADGRKQSVARRYVCGDNAPVYQGFVNWIGVARSAVPLMDVIAICDYWGIGERFGIVALDPHTAYWAAAAADANEADDVPEPDARAVVEQRFASWPAPIDAVIRATPAQDVRKIRVYDHDPLDVWHRDNVLLIGDAAHAPLPTSGQGACQAFEDAWHLAGCIGGGDIDLPAALTLFGARRHAKTARITTHARDFARMLFTTDARACRERDASAQRADPIADTEALARAWGAGLPLAGAATG
ncbi:FAD-dependent oxidoreductase [Burkholderia sp. Bp8963]|uniref:FAD-dependent oxidoreductase n=1 Tax=Burkholderia sp. Bp8963 TaxID=2184547 RepID=UPI000F59C656|nr:FAD-dependent oxidoreductase [Burkholderia sp. Bp8963]RQS69780.1 FAD-dependent oxidoreductase [Burkholderia sp. Bp8963]